MTVGERQGDWREAAPGAPATAAAAAPWAGRLPLSPRRWGLLVGPLAIATLVAMATCLRFGAEDISWAEMARILLHALTEGPAGIEAAGPAGVILLDVRLPRILLGFMVGGSLAAVGVGLQALLRNPLADPYVLGISSGAALGAAVAVLLGIGTSWLAVSALPLCAFVGALAAILIVYRIAVTYGRLPVHTLLLAGVVLNAIFSALIMFVTSIMDPNRSYGMMFWLMGTLTAPRYPVILALAAYLALGTLFLFRQARALDLLTLGEETALSLGVEVEAVKRTVFFTAALLTGAVVSVSGMIGFVGMVVPHAARLLVGADHRLLLPVAALVGGTALMAADTAARTMLAPGEIPVGVVTALAGGPVFMYLLTRRTGGLA
jgi:iron complex transport system permease protein